MLVQCLVSFTIGFSCFVWGYVAGQREARRRYERLRPLQEMRRWEVR
jgi:hypothetical protein